MKCCNCGKEIADNMPFCYNCGTKQESQQPAVQEPENFDDLEKTYAVRHVKKEPVNENAAPQQPAFQQPVAPQPAVQQPVIQQPIVQQPIVQQPVHQPVVQHPVNNPYVPAQYTPSKKKPNLLAIIMAIIAVILAVVLCVVIFGDGGKKKSNSSSSGNSSSDSDDDDDNDSDDDEDNDSDDDEDKDNDNDNNNDATSTRKITTHPEYGFDVIENPNAGDFENDAFTRALAEYGLELDPYLEKGLYSMSFIEEIDTYTDDYGNDNIFIETYSCLFDENGLIHSFICVQSCAPMSAWENDVDGLTEDEIAQRYAPYSDDVEGSKSTADIKDGYLILMTEFENLDDDDVYEKVYDETGAPRYAYDFAEEFEGEISSNCYYISK